MTHRTPFALTLALGLACSTVAAQENTWDKNAQWLQDQIAACSGGSNADACRFFAAKALNQLFGLSEFCKGEVCTTSTWIAAAVKDNWETVGPATDAAALKKAQEMATGGMAVIAASLDGDKGQVAIIMPGKPVFSGKWKGAVPVAVAARVDKPEASINGKGINFVFSDPSKVTLYAHK